MSARKTEALVHFSGGSDSTLCAALLAEENERVHLVTYDRISFLGTRDYTAQNYERLCKVYGKEKFIRKIVAVDGLHRKICYHDYLRLAAKHKLAVTGLCFSKLAMHWSSAAYAVENGIGVVADGSVPYMELYPDQNEEICHRWLRPFYRSFGIEYRTPVFSLADRVEEMLYDKGITEIPDVRGSDRDKQVFYLEQVLLAFFIKYYVTTHGKAKYVSELSAIFKDRIDYMASEIRSRR